MKNNISNVEISDFINKDYRQYAIKTLEARGIPSFYDALNPAQRYIINAAPSRFVSCIKIVGDAKSSGYKHADDSLEKSIVSLTRPFRCSDPILIGDGFFGSPIEPRASAPRYTSAMLSPNSKKILDKYSVLNKADIDGYINKFHVDMPIGLLKNIKGIGVGYASDILPRKPEHIISFLEGKRKTLNPWFRNFNGTIEKVKGSKCSWIINPDISHNTNHTRIYVKDISPTIKYPTYLKSLAKIIGDTGCSLLNDSKDKIDITIKTPRGMSAVDRQNVYDKILSISTEKYTENVLFVMDSTVLIYDSVEDYMQDFSRYRVFVERDYYTNRKNHYDSELEYLKAKLEYLIFMNSKKRKLEDIENFLSTYDRGIYNRLDSIRLRNLNSEYIAVTKKEIQDMENSIKGLEDEISSIERRCDEIGDFIHNANRSSIK